MTINTVFFADPNSKTDFNSDENETGDVCIANISPLERQKRMRFGVTQFIITLVILAVLMILGVNHFWRLPLLLMFWAAATGYFQARDKT